MWKEKDRNLKYLPRGACQGKEYAYQNNCENPSKHVHRQKFLWKQQIASRHWRLFAEINSEFIPVILQKPDLENHTVPTTEQRQHRGSCAQSRVTDPALGRLAVAGGCSWRACRWNNLHLKYMPVNKSAKVHRCWVTGQPVLSLQKGFSPAQLPPTPGACEGSKEGESWDSPLWYWGAMKGLWMFCPTSAEQWRGQGGAALQLRHLLTGRNEFPKHNSKSLMICSNNQSLANSTTSYMPQVSLRPPGVCFSSPPPPIFFFRVGSRLLKTKF